MDSVYVTIFLAGLVGLSSASDLVNSTVPANVTSPEVVSVNATRGNSSGLSRARSLPYFRSLLENRFTLPFVAHDIGALECTGVDGLTGGHFFETILEEQGADFGGNYLCGPTCEGDCIPNQDTGVAPSSLYAFGCRCKMNRCGPGGPDPTRLNTGRFKVVCVPDERCTCAGMGVKGIRFEGYLCNWINLSSHKLVTYLDRNPINPTFSPIRWCSCCPQPYSGPN